MESGGWLVAIIVAIVMVGALATLVLGIGAVDPGAMLPPEPLPRTAPVERVLLNPWRVGAGVGASIVLIGLALAVIRRTDWSQPEA